MFGTGMKFKRAFFIGATVVTIGALHGCIQLSLHPLYDNTSACVTDDNLIGTFRPAADQGHSDQDVGSSDDVWVFSKPTDSKGNLYRLDYQDESHKQSVFDVGIVKLGDGERYLDVYPSDDLEGNQGDVFKFHFVPMHSVIRIDLLDANGMTLRLPSYDWVNKYLKAHPDAIEYQEMDDDDGGWALLTAGPADLRKFWEKQKDNADAFLAPIHLVKQKEEKQGDGSGGEESGETQPHK